MPLTEFYEGRVLSPKSRCNHKCVIALGKKIPSSFSRICTIIDAVLDQVIQDRLGKLVYTRTGFLLGNHSVAPMADINYIWRIIPTTLIGKTTMQLWEPGESKLVLQTIGAMVMWRISLRPEDWKVSFLESGKFDYVTGNEIKIAQYWTNDYRSM